MLKDECDRGRVDWRMPCAVDGVAREGDRFVVHAGDTAFRCASLVVATGGLTVPKIGATPFGYRIAEQFGLAVVPPRPALVPLAFAPDALARYGDLSGVSVDAEVACNGGRFRENLLFTHRGLSGPAILQISSYWDGRSPLSIDLLPGTDVHAWLAAHRQSDARLPNLLAERLPKRFAQAWCAAHDAAVPVRQLSDERLRDVAARLGAWEVLPSGTLGLQQGRSHAGRRRHAGPVVEDDGGGGRARPLLHRRSRRRHRLARRLQLPVGVGLGARGRAVRLTAAPIPRTAHPRIQRSSTCSNVSRLPASSQGFRRLRSRR